MCDALEYAPPDAWELKVQEYMMGVQDDDSADESGRTRAPE